MAVRETTTDVSRERGKVLRAGAIGNVIEWYDFAVYGYFATSIAGAFFPAGNRVAALLGTFAVFAVAYFARPLGAFLLGHIGDRLGRRVALAVAITMMALGTTAIGVIPSYSTIGLAAPVLLVVARVLQGISVGGEFGGAATLVVEYARPGRRGFLAALLQTSTALGLLLGSAVGWLLTTVLGEASVDGWGWRIPFLLGIPLGAIGFYVRRRLNEPPQYARLEAAEALASAPLLEVLRTHGPALARSMGMIVAWLFSGGVVLVYLPTYLNQVHDLTRAESLTVTFVGLIAYVAFIPVTGVLSDRFGRKPVLLVAAIGLAAAAYPCFLMLQTPDRLWLNIVGNLVLLWFLSLFGGPVPAILSEQFPTRVRVSGVGVSYAVTVAVFQGTAPLVVTYLIGATGYAYTPALLMVLVTVPSLVAILCTRDTARDELT